MSYVNSVTVYPSSATITKGKWYYGAYASISSNFPECAEVEWYSNSPAIASVNKTTGYIYGVSTGTTRIYAEATDGSGKKDYITVTVTAPVSVTGVSVCPTSKSMDVGCTDYLYETIYPSNATNQTVTWCSSDDTVAEVNTYTGFVRAKKAGIVTITATTADGGYSDSCEVTVFYDTVTIQKDGDFNKVVFNKSGKVWRCINRDMVFSDIPLGSSLFDRSNLNFYGHTEYNNNIITYTDDEIKLLYAIDPYGVADYVCRYASEIFKNANKTQSVENSLRSSIGYKDRIFRMLFNREPKYFARKALDGAWYKVDDYEEINDVLSESEVYFGMHPVYDMHTFLQMLGVCSSILDIVFLTNFFSEKIVGEVIKDVVTTGLLIVSGYEALLRGEFLEYAANTIVGLVLDKKFEKTFLNWAYKYVSLYESLQDLVDAMTLDLNYNKEIINYCACDTGYNVLFEMKNGMTYRLHDVCDLINQ